MSFSQSSENLRDLVITTTDNKKVIIENYYTNSNANATKSSVKTLRLETESGGFNEFDLNTLIKYNAPFTPSKNFILHSVLLNSSLDNLILEQSKIIARYALFY